MAFTHIVSVALLGLLLAHPLCAAGNIWYISPFGRDSNSGTSTDDAFLTLSRALNASSAHDTVSISPGSYNGPLNTDLTISTPITLHASSGNPVFTCSSSNSVALNIAADTAIDGLKFISCNTALKYTDGSVFTLTNVILDSPNFAITTSVGYKSFDMKDVKIIRGISTFGTTSSNQAQADSLTFTGCTFGGNGLLTVKIYKTSLITIDKCVFENLVLQYSFSNTLYIDSGDVDISNTMFQNIDCYYAGYGCGLHYRGGDQLRITQSTFKNFTKTGSGGALALYDGKALIQTSEFDTLTATDNGGAIYIGSSSAQLNVYSSDYSACSASRGATVFCFIEGQYYCDSCTEEDNTESLSGGC